MDDLGVPQVPADAAEEVLGGRNHAAELTGLGGGCLQVGELAEQVRITALRALQLTSYLVLFDEQNWMLCGRREAG